MAATPEPSPLSRRSFSLPIAKDPRPSDTQIEVLYTLKSARVVDFTSSSSSSRPSSSHDAPAADDEVAKLSWISPRERTIAVGPLRIYRAPGSVAFLNCANALRPILPKSQAWCVDGDSKFVLQVRRPQYWRIEVSNETEEDKAKVDELKKVFGEVLLFEKTPCPFQRDFQIELPEVVTPVTKRPWRPVQGPRPQTPNAQEGSFEFGYTSPGISRRASSASPLRHSLLSISRRNSGLDLAGPVNANEKHSQLSASSTPPNEVEETIPETGETQSSEAHISSPHVAPIVQVLNARPNEVIIREKSRPVEVIRTSGDSISGDGESDGSEATDNTPRPGGRLSLDLGSLKTSIDDQPQEGNPHSQDVKSVPYLEILTSSNLSEQETAPPQEAAVESESPSSSIDSWHSISSSDSEPSSPTHFDSYFQDNEHLADQKGVIKDGPGADLLYNDTRTWDISSSPATEPDYVEFSSSPEPHTPTLIQDGSEKSEDDKSEIITPSTIRSGIRHRATTSSNSRRRQLSPLPAAANLFTPSRSRPRHLQTARHLPTAIIQKTCEILLSPPSHLFNLMISIASKIAAGEWRGVLLGYGEAVHWDLEDEHADQTWHEDDFGLQLRANPSRTKARGSTWEVD